MKKRLSIGAIVLALSAMCFMACSNATDTVVKLNPPKISGMSIYGANIITWTDVPNAGFRLVVNGEEVTLTATNYYEDKAVEDGVEKTYSIITKGTVNPGAIGLVNTREAYVMDSKAATLKLKGKKALVGTNAFDLEKHRNDFGIDKNGVAKKVTAELDENDEYVITFPAKKWAKYSVGYYGENEWEANGSPFAGAGKTGANSINKTLPLFGADSGTITVKLPVIAVGEKTIFIKAEGIYDSNIDAEALNTGVKVNAMALDLNSPGSVVAKVIDPKNDNKVRIAITPAVLKDGTEAPKESYTIYRAVYAKGSISDVVEYVKLEGDLEETDSVIKEDGKIYYIDDEIEDKTIQYAYHVVVKRENKYAPLSAVTIATSDWKTGKFISSVKAPTLSAFISGEDKDGLKNDLIVTLDKPNIEEPETAKVKVYLGNIGTTGKVEYDTENPIELKYNGSKYIGYKKNLENGKTYYAYAEYTYTNSVTLEEVTVTSDTISTALIIDLSVGAITGNVSTNVDSATDKKDFYITITDTITVATDSMDNWKYTASYAPLTYDYVGNNNYPVTNLSVGDWTDITLSALVQSGEDANAGTRSYESVTKVSVPSAGEYIVKLTKSSTKDETVKKAVTYKSVTVNNVSGKIPGQLASLVANINTTGPEDADKDVTVDSSTTLTTLKSITVKLTAKKGWFTGNADYQKAKMALDYNAYDATYEDYDKDLEALNLEWQNKVCGDYVVYRKLTSDVNGNDVHINDSTNGWVEVGKITIAGKPATKDGELKYSDGSWEGTLRDSKDLKRGVKYQYMAIGAGKLDLPVTITSADVTVPSNYR